MDFIDDGKRWYSDGRFSDVLQQKGRRVWEEGVQRLSSIGISRGIPDISENLFVSGVSFPPNVSKT